jgi:hypothetical protein
MIVGKKRTPKASKKAKTFSLIPINDSRMNHLEERGNDTNQAMEKQSDSDYDVKYTTVKFNDKSRNSKSDHWIGMKFYVGSPDMISYLGLNF